jgi:small GTP-binding protein
MSARKVMLLGEIGVGKSSLVRRLVHDKFDIDYTPTIGVDVYSYEVPAAVAGQRISLVIFDTDGNYSESIFKHVYVKEAAAALVVGDITRRSTLDMMVRLADGFIERLPGRHYSFITNKIDLLDDREPVERPPGLVRPGVPLLDTSALSGARVKDAFHETALAILRRGL